MTSTRSLEQRLGDFTADTRVVTLTAMAALGRAGIMAAWLHATGEERTREPGWLTEHLTILRERMAKVLAGSG